MQDKFHFFPGYQTEAQACQAAVTMFYELHRDAPRAPHLQEVLQSKGLVANHQPAIERLLQQQHESADLHTHTKRPRTASMSTDEDRPLAQHVPSASGEALQAFRDPRGAVSSIPGPSSHAMQHQQQQRQPEAGQQPPKARSNQRRKQQGSSRKDDNTYTLPRLLLPKGKKTWRHGYNHRDTNAATPIKFYQVDLRFSVSGSLRLIHAFACIYADEA